MKGEGENETGQAVGGQETLSAINPKQGENQDGKEAEGRYY